MARKKAQRHIESQGLLLQDMSREGLAAGLDEAGRGCLAGPVVAGAVVFAEGFDLVGLGDSKTIKEADRVRLGTEIRQLALGWGIGLAWPQEIAKYNILQASLLAMARSVAALRHRMNLGPEKSDPMRLLIDGNQRIPPPFLRQYAIPLPHQQVIVGGDALIPSISAASILAKTFRDGLMLRLDARWPHYGFARHKGYGSKAHRDALKEYGPCPIHRLDFRGVVPEKLMEQGRLC